MREIKNVNVAVIGGAGFLGSHLADAVLAQGHEVLAVANHFYRLEIKPWPPSWKPKPRVSEARCDFPLIC